MTKDQFITTAKASPYQINIWYSDNTQGPQFYIFGLTIPVVDQENENILGYLQQSTELTVELQEGIVETLQVQGGELHTADDQTTLIYYRGFALCNFKYFLVIIFKSGCNLRYYSIKGILPRR